MRRWIRSIAVAACAAGLLGVAPPAPTDDAGIVAAAFTELHPGLTRYVSDAAFRANVETLRAALAAAPDRRAAYVAVAAFAAALRCGHTFPNPLNQPRETATELWGAGHAWPLRFRWLDGHAIVTRALADPPVAAGDEIVRFDGTPAAGVLQRMLPLISADGGNDARRLDLAALGGDDDFPVFAALYPALFGATGGVAQLEVATAGAAPRKVALRLDAPVVAAAPDAPRFTVRDERDHTAVLTMPTWVVFNTRWPWHAFIDDAFAGFARRGITSLIVDLRGNGGGNDVGDAVVAHLIDAPLQHPGYERRVRFRSVTPELRPYLSTWDPSFYDLGTGAQPAAGGSFRLADGDDRAIAPAAPRFRGRVLVLVDAANSSATFTFADLVRRKALATLVGEPTGGNRRGINGGAFFFLTLPHAKIELDVPLIGTFPLTPQPDAGIVPDVVVHPVASDYASGCDRIMQTALRIARGARPSASSPCTP